MPHTIFVWRKTRVCIRAWCLSIWARHSTMFNIKRWSTQWRHSTWFGIKVVHQLPTDRQQQVRCVTSITSPAACSHEGPQGSVNGPLLFLLYTSCIPESCRISQVSANVLLMTFHLLWLEITIKNRNTSLRRGLDFEGLILQFPLPQHQHTFCQLDWVFDKKICWCWGKGNFNIMPTQQERNVHLRTLSDGRGLSKCGLDKSGVLTPCHLSNPSWHFPQMLQHSLINCFILPVSWPHYW